jgi:predicted nucleic acid-binding protein
MPHEMSVLVVAFSPELVQRATHLYAQRQDKGWSVTDCLSFIVMQDFDISEALTADRHFEQAGFSALLLREPS